MSKRRNHYIEIVTLDKGLPLHAMNCHVLMDGKRLLGVRRVSFDIDITKRGFTPIKIEMEARVRLAGGMKPKITASPRGKKT